MHLPQRCKLPQSLAASRAACIQPPTNRSDLRLQRLSKQGGKYFEGGRHGVVDGRDA
jgi:hypothetical protein